MYNLKLLAKAEDELADAYDWYEQQLLGSGNKFYHEVNYYSGLIESNPYHFPIKYTRDLRSAALRKFPFLIIYWIDSNNLVIVTSIFHTSRNPRLVKS